MTTEGEAQRSASDIRETTGNGTGDILCLHDGYHRELNYDRTRTLAALEHWLPRWRDLGLEFVTIDEAVGTPAP
jgi:peptidoglycan/xylan/chitin deacetylase (PgdA/CDA1 family)